MTTIPTNYAMSIIDDIVIAMNNGLRNNKDSWTVTELTDELTNKFHRYISKHQVRYILEEYQGGILTPWWKSTHGNKVIWYYTKAI